MCRTVYGSILVLVLLEGVLVFSVQADSNYDHEQQVVGGSGSDCVKRVHIRLIVGFFLHTTCRYSRFSSSSAGQIHAGTPMNQAHNCNCR
jgi:hypothetical protein